MADNTVLPGISEIYASKERGGAVKYQRVLTAMDDGPSIDAFGRMRSSNPTTIFDSKLLGLDDQPLFWDEQLETGAGITASTPTAAKPYIDFTSTLDTAGKLTRQTFRRFNYQPGKSQMVLMTGVLILSGGGAGVETRIGYFDDDNGLFFEYDAGTVGVTIRSNDSGTPTDTTIEQASWNLDTMDGTNTAANPSGRTADWTKSQIFILDFQWLAVGRVRFGIDIGGELCFVHEFVSSANVSAIPYMSTPNLPLRYQMITTGSSPVSSMRCICGAVLSEGGTDDIGLVRCKSTGGTEVVTDAENTKFALVGIRLKSTHLGATIKMLKADVQIQTASEFLEWQLIFNPTVAGTFTYSDETNGAVQTALGATANTVTGGTVISGGYAATGNAPTGGGSDSSILANALKLGAAIDGTPDEIVLVAMPIGGVSAMNVEGSLVWREIY